MDGTTRFCCAVSRNDQLNAAGKYRHVLSIGLKGVNGNIDTCMPPIIAGARGINVPISRGGPPTESA